MQDHDGRRAEASPWTRLLRNDDRLTWTIAEAADLRGISRTRAYEAAHRDELPVKVIGLPQRGWPARRSPSCWAATRQPCAAGSTATTPTGRPAWPANPALVGRGWAAPGSASASAGC